jgi:signal transduction histidine kinase/ligand-binding sensor domain-containing protein/DNA-binding response OmpR family regulator
MYKSYIVFAIFGLAGLLYAPEAKSQLRFDKFALNDKLTSNSVIRSYNDDEGYIWIGTKDGLCRYDGYDIKTFRSSAFTPGRLTNNEIQCLSEDPYQRIWIGTLEGVNIIDKKNYSIKELENAFVKKERINSIIRDSNGKMWVGTSTNGIVCFDPKDMSFERYTSDKESKYSLLSRNVTNLYEDKNNRIWISSWKNGLCFIDTKNNQVKYCPKIGVNNNPFRVYQDRDGLYWICTWGDGIYNATIDENSNISIRKIRLENEPNEKVDNIVYSIVQDDNPGLIWIVAFNGLTVLQKQPDGSCRQLETDKMFDTDEIRLFHEISKDKKGNLWLGTIGKGLYRLDFKKNKVRNYALDNIQDFIHSPSFNVSKICPTNTNKVDIAISRIGLFNLDLTTGKVSEPHDPVLRRLTNILAMTNIPSANELWLSDEGKDIIYVFKNNSSNDPVFAHSFTLNGSVVAQEKNVNVIFEDSYGNLWLGSDDGLYIKTPGRKAKLLVAKCKYINTISEDIHKNIFVGTEKDGLFLLKYCGGEKRKYAISKVNLKVKTYQSYSVQSICCAKNGKVYIGTKEGCIYLYELSKNHITEISAVYGITDNGIVNIAEDKKGFIWISSIKKIIRYNPQTHASTYFSTTDGLIVNSFYKDAYAKLQSGIILFGGNNGICAFNPTGLNTAHESSRAVTITDILVQNKSVFDDERYTHFDLKNNRITLKYSENNLGFEFAYLDYASAGKVQYAYRLSGIDNNWNYTSSSRRYVNYSNLPDGNYKFEIKATDENGNWSNQVTSLKVRILPPFYRTWWAYMFYLTVIGLSINFFGRNIAKRIRLSNELKISKIEKEKSEELAQIKLRYFTNISHELLTPLTIILLQIERLQQKISGEKAQFDIMKDNVLRLKRLIQQILIFRKTESGNMKLKVQKEDIVNFVINICNSNFRPLVEQKKIELILDFEKSIREAYFDPDKLDKVIYNLLSNSFKYTPEYGTVAMKMSFIDRNQVEFMRLSVADTGAGISEDDLPHIFERFYISRHADQSQSHGIGLALTYDLLQLHKGSIIVKSNLGEGSVFTIEIPVSGNAYTDDEMSKDEPETGTLSDMANALVVFEPGVKEEPLAQEKKNSTILVVEDNKELNRLIVETFAEKYQVLTAFNGKQALEITEREEIDVIISDVMMPEMDGLTFCKIIKNDLKTSHIDVLMLTAKNSTEDRIECYNAGADAYIAKPFELSVLNARVNNLINRRLVKNESFRKNIDINISTMEYNSIDEVFLNQAIKKVEEKLADEKFDFDQFAVDMATSKSTLHRKIKSLTGLSPGEFIRNIRMKHALQMLSSNSGNVSEISYAVGFNDPKYFSRCFKLEFGYTPKEYLENIKSQKNSD